MGDKKKIFTGRRNVLTGFDNKSAMDRTIVRKTSRFGAANGANRTAIVVPCHPPPIGARRAALRRRCLLLTTTINWF